MGTPLSKPATHVLMSQQSSEFRSGNLTPNQHLAPNDEFSPQGSPSKSRIEAIKALSWTFLQKVLLYSKAERFQNEHFNFACVQKKNNQKAHP